MKLECHEIDELTGAYLTDQLNVQERFRMEMHLDACPACAAELAEYTSIAAAMKQDFDAEDQQPALDTHRRESLITAWNQSQRLPLNTTRSTWKTIRRTAVTLAAAAAVIIGSYLGFASGHQRVEPNTVTLELATLPTTIAPAQESSIDTPPASTGIPYPEFIQSTYPEFPEYGMGSTVFASRSTRAPYIGLPVPRFNYDFNEASLGNE